MKKTILTIALCLLMLGITENVKSQFDEKKYLNEILNNLEQINSVSYIQTTIMNQRGDTVPMLDRPIKNYYKEFSNPADTATGISFVIFDATDTTKLAAFYHENVYVSLRHDIKAILVDSANFRGGKVFFNSVKNIIRYALNPNDSISTEFHDFGDSLLFRLNVYADRGVMLDDKRPVYFSGGSNGIELSNYDVWINKATGLPFKRKTIFSARSGIYWEDLDDVQMNKMDINNFVPSRYFPEDYDIIMR